MRSRARSIVVAVSVCCLLVAGAVAANVALLGIADHTHDRVGRLQLRLAKPPADVHSTTQPPAPVLVVTTPPPTTAADDAHEGPDD